MAYENCPFDVTPYDKSNIVKNPELVNLNYTNQDFWSMKSRLMDYIKERFADSFNDFIESDLALMLVENWSFIADTLSFKIDQIANEIFIDTVSEVDNAFRLAMLVGFRATPPIASSSKWSASINQILDTDLIIPAPVLIDISTEEGPKTIELFPSDSENNPVFNEDIIISAGSFLNSAVIGLEGRTVSDTYSGTGAINQSINLTRGPVIWNSIRVDVDGTAWNQVEYFTDSQPRREYRVEYDPNYNAFIMFGNNRAGLIPSENSQVVVTYRVGGGVAGNIVTGSVEIQRNYNVPGFDFRLPATFRNYTRGQYGYAGDTIDDIKRKLPLWLRAQNRLVTGSDYQTLVNQFTTEYHGQVGKSKATLRESGCAANIIDIYILSKDGEMGLVQSSNELKVALQEMLEEKKMITDKACIKNGVVIEVDVNLDIVMDKFYRKFEDEFRERITRKIMSFFSLNNWDYQKDLKSIDIIKEISDIKEIISTEVNFITDDEENSGDIVTTRFFEIIRPNTIEINFLFE